MAMTINLPENYIAHFLKPLSANQTKWSNTFKQLVGFCSFDATHFDHFVGLALEMLISQSSTE